MPAELAAVISNRAKAEGISLNKLICGILNDESTRQTKAQDVSETRADRENQAVVGRTESAESDHFEHLEPPAMGETAPRIFLDETMPKGEVLLVSGKSAAKIVNATPPDEPRCKHGYLACVMCGFNVPKQGKR